MRSALAAPALGVRATPIMKISRGLELFLSEALIKSKRERFLNFLGSDKGQIKFAKSLSHDLEKFIEPTKVVSRFSGSELKQQGNLYCSNGVTNDSFDTMINLYGKAPWEGGWLLVNKQGTLAIYRPEGKIDDELYIKL